MRNLPRVARASNSSGKSVLARLLSLVDFEVEEKNEANPGRVHCEVHYWIGSTEDLTNDGVVEVRVMATRLSG
jgi:hypothetical protein